jgi:general L-amino acid transport system permease protein
MSENTAGVEIARPSRGSIWNDRSARAVFYQALLIAAVVGAAYYLVSNTLDNLSEREIRTGFGFLDQEAGFFIGETVIPFDAADSYLRAFFVGLLNTLRVASIGIVFASIIGVVVGIARLSRNWLIAKMATVYVETVRNVPLLLQLFFWYSLITGALPAGQEALSPLPGIFLNKSGLAYAVPRYDLLHPYLIVAFAIGCIGAWLYRRWARARQEEAGEQRSIVLPVLALVLALPLAVFVLGGAPLALDMPEWQGFRYAGGDEITPEFMALLFGLTIYTAGFIAEIVRSGLLAVDWGQTEAALALGLRRGRVLRLVVLPQALRVIIPPITSQYLNITKNSSLAVAIGYPDLVSVTNTSLNQTGQAIECIAILMAVYLTISLAISTFMNWYNRLAALVEH